MSLMHLYVFILIVFTLMFTGLFAQTQVGDTSFSVDRGFYTSAISLEIATDTPGATIYYTTDGSLPTEANGLVYEDAIEITTTTVVRAFATIQGGTPTNVDTHTYLYPSDIVNQPASISGYAEPTYGTGGGGPTVRMDYEMDTRIISDPAYSSDVITAFSDIPSMCISIDPSLIFGNDNFYDGEEVEAQVSVEALYPNDPSSNEKVEAGIESHSHERLKRSMRLNFRSEYGDSRWDTDLFRNAPFNPDNRVTPNEVKRIILRAGNNRAWSRTFSREKTTFVIDEFSRLSQQEMSGDGMRGAFVHLFINGIYWGLYNPVVRADTFYTSEIYGGDEEDWFSVNHGGDLRGVDDRYDYLRGDLKDQDMSVIGNYEELTEHLDIDNFIDYLLVHWYTNTGDWPQNNWYGGLRNSSAPEGPVPMKFFAWDGEWSWDLPHSSIRNIAPDPDDTWVHPNFESDDDKDSGRVIPDLFNSAKDNPLFIRRLADRAYQHLANGGALTDEVASDRFAGLASYVENAVVAESARWGDALDDDGDGDPLFTRDIHWADEVSDLLDYIDGRAPKLIEALRDEGYYPEIDPPLMSQHGGEVMPGFTLAISAPASSPNLSIYYTLDGSDPIENGVLYQGPIILSDSTRVLARITDEVEWSAAADANFLLPTRLPLVVSEVHYHPSGELEGHTEDNDLEYLELSNVGEDLIDLEGYEFTSGITLVFAEGATLAPGETAVIVGDRSCFEAWYGLGPRILGDYSGKLSNGGERIRLESSLGQEVINFEYEDDWHPMSDGGDYSLQLVGLSAESLDQAEWSLASGWIDSGIPDGTPGTLAPDILAFDEWLEAHGMESSALGDIDGDGYGSLMEYVFGTHPLQNDRPNIKFDEVELRYVIRDDRKSVTLTLQVSTELGETSWRGVETMSEEVGAQVEHVFEWPEEPSQFFRFGLSHVESDF